MVCTLSFRWLLAVAGITWLAGCSPKVGVALSTADLSAALPAGTPYALLHVYRPSRVAGFAIGYDVRANDTIFYRASNGSQAELRRRSRGPLEVSAKTEAREALTLTLEPGREYYVRCTIGAGLLVGRPRLTQVSVAEGRADVARLAGK